jgi:transglutaminase-like putative cysteine protease
MHKLTLLGLGFLFFCIANLNAVELKYPVSEIPDSLLKNAKAVVRDYSVDFEMKDLNSIVETITTATTILDRSADNHAIGLYPYSKEETIAKIEACFYDKNGKLYEKKGRNDFKDESYDTYGTLYSDSRYLRYKPLTAEYPYTVEYKVTYRQNNSYSFPSWYPFNESDVSVQYSSMNVVIPKDYEVRIKEGNFPQSHTQTEVDGKLKLFWEVKNLKAEEDEVYTPEISSIQPYVKLSPNVFEYENYEGNMSSWKEYGLFRTELLKERDQLPEQTINKINEITKNSQNDLEKTRIIYNYLQNNTRYVNISEGIGSIQPIPASEIVKSGYGDCKGLSNYMKALIKIVGIKSYYSAIKAGQNKYSYDIDFVNHQTNHIILCVPLENDTIWLECTSQIYPFGYLGDFTDNRYALLVTDEGGKLVKTKEYKHTMNQVKRNAEVILKPDGAAVARIKTSYEGLEYGSILGLIHSDYKTQKDYLYNSKIDIPDFKIDSFRYKDYPAIDPIGEEFLNLNLINYASVSGTRMFVALNLMNRFNEIPPKDDDRKNPIMIYDNYIHTDSISYQIPDGYKIEFVPENNSIESDFATVQYTFISDSNRVLYTRKLDFYCKEHPKEKYNDFVAFCKNLKKTDNLKLVLVKVE